MRSPKSAVPGGMARRYANSADCQPCPGWCSRKHAVRARLPWAAMTVAAWLAAVPASAEESRAQETALKAGPQLRVGVLQHDLNGYGGSEDGIDLTFELRGAPLQGGFWRRVFSPRPHIGVNLNDSGATSSLYAGLSWMADFARIAYVSADFGGAVHDGKLETTDPDRAELGSRVLFREALELGLRPSERWRVGVRVDHISNANLASENDGITNIGLVVSREF